jgi:predicted transcriptional regulator
MLKRCLQRRYDMSPADYRRRWSLPDDHPMTVPAYAERRSALAKQIGLGRRPAAAEAPEPAPGPKAKPPRRRAAGRRPSA